jgi:hypothetical protein
MNYLETMSQSVASVKENDLRFGPAEGVFETTAKLSSLMLDKELTPYDIVTILRCLNDARKKYNPTGPYHYIENINLEAFALQFAAAQDARSEAAAAKVAEKFAASACPSQTIPETPSETSLSGAGFP